MTGVEVGLLMSGGLLVLLMLGMPIAFSLGLSGLAGLAAMQGASSFAFLVGAKPYTFTAVGTFIIVPMFLLMSHLAFSAGLSEKAFTAARAWVGHIRGGLAMTTILACAGFAAVSGSSVATAATVSRIAIPEMLRSGYSKQLSAGVVAAGGTLGVLIPPSGILVIYSIATETKLSDLLIATIGPAILTVSAYLIGIYLLAAFRPHHVPSVMPAKASWKTSFAATGKSWEVLLLFSIIMGSIYLGIATPTESAGIGAAAAFIMAALRLKGGSSALVQGFIETAGATSAIFALIVGAGLFSVALTSTQIPQLLVDWVSGLGLDPTVLLLLVLVPYLFLGCFVDPASMLLLTLPIIFPIIVEAGINPVLFGILVTKMTEIGAITPPVGLNVFVISGTFPEIRLNDAFKGAFPFVVIELTICGILIAFPVITLGFI